MSSPTQSSPTWISEYQSRFGAPPGGEATKAELERFILMCQELLQQRELLSKELARTQEERDRILKALAAYMAKELPQVDVDYETLRAQAVQSPSLPELIAELGRDL
jgi:hypothetical protein